MDFWETLLICFVCDHPATEISTTKYLVWRKQKIFLFFFFVCVCFFNLGFFSAEASMLKLREKTEAICRVSAKK
jgi:hypothetical protein